MNDYGSSLLSTVYKTNNKITDSNKNDIFILQHIDPIILGIILKLRFFKNLIFCIHTDIVSYYKSSSFFKKLFLKIMFGCIKNEPVVFVSKEGEEKAKHFFGLQNTSTIYNAFPFSKTPIKQNGSKPIALGSVSRLTTLKNIDLAIRVIKECNKNSTNIILKIYGSGSEETALKEYVQKLGCEDFVFFMGESKDISAIYNSFDALLSFSTLEGLPTVILEAINYKTPIFYTDCNSGPRELMSPRSDALEKTKYYEATKTGYLVKPVLKHRPYAVNLDDYEKEYVSFLNCFISDVENQNFSMEFDSAPFSETVILQQWLHIIQKEQI